MVDAVQMLTGLDEIAELGDFIAVLAHKGRDYLGYAKANGLDLLKGQFIQHLAVAEKNLLAIGRQFPKFEAKDAVDEAEAMSRLTKELSANASASILLISTDLASDLDLSLATVQQQVAHAIESAKTDLANGLDDLPTSLLLDSIERIATSDIEARLMSSLATCRKSLEEAESLRIQAESDNRFQMKAIAAAWHEQHRDGAIEDCPLCDQSLESHTGLLAEIEQLRSAGEAAQRTFRDNLNAVRTALEATIPGDLLQLKKAVLATNPSESYKTEIAAKFVDAPRYANTLHGLRAVVDKALRSSPSDVLPLPERFALTESSPENNSLADMVNLAERILWLRSWKKQRQQAWRDWWKVIADGDAGTDQSTYRSKLTKLDDAIKAGTPYRDAAKSLADAITAGLKIHTIEAEQKRRDDIADALSPLKDLRKFAEAETKRAIEELSAKMTGFLEEIYVSDKLKFQSTVLDKKSGITVRASIEPELCIDASLVANTSWIRALLWAFVFALREEAIEQLGEDSFPLLVLDDPQATFDMHHSLRWIQRIIAYQKATVPMQVILTTYDESFIDQLNVAGFSGRHCYLSAANSDIGHVHVVEGRGVDRAWQKAKKENTADAAFSYISQMRIHVEAMLKVMLRGEQGVRNSTMGELKQRMKTLTASSTPWTRHEFKDLYGQLDGTPQVKYLEQSHHTTQRTLSMANAVDVEKYWRDNLQPALNRAFRAIKEYRLLHGESKALYADPATVSMPEGYKEVIRKLPLVVYGRASASTGGRAADGNLSIEELGEDQRDKIVLGNNEAFRLTAPTLEPVARKGDILLTCEHAKVLPGSLVVVGYTDRILARRFMTSVEHPDVAVLIAQSISPSDIAAPIVVHKSSITMHKVVGVLFDPDVFTPTQNTSSEVTGCNSEEEINKFGRGTVRLFKVSGSSAEPQALDGQFFLTRDAVTTAGEFRKLDGRPVFAVDSDGHQYFKRLRLVRDDAAVLESIHIGGDFPPIFLSTKPQVEPYLAKVFPVTGVLFER